MVALLLAGSEEVLRFVVTLEAAGASSVRDEARPEAVVPEITPGPDERLVVGQLRPLEVDDDGLPGLGDPMPLPHLAADVLQAVIKLDVLIAPADEVRVIPVRLDEILGDHLARAGRQEPGHVEAARPVVDAAHRDYVDVVKHEIPGHAVVESSPGGDVAAQSEVEQIFALLLGDVDRVI